jgi:hypothetical protein
VVPSLLRNEKLATLSLFCASSSVLKKSVFFLVKNLDYANFHQGHIELYLKIHTHACEFHTQTCHFQTSELVFGRSIERNLSTDNSFSLNFLLNSIFFKIFPRLP